jgi:tetratricopeptide (TPR) repeat protein
MMNAGENLEREAWPAPGRNATALLVIVALAVYCNSFTGVFLLDDYYWLIEGHLNRDILPAWWTLSMRWVSFWTLAVNYGLDGLNVRGYHAVNLAIHVGAALTLYGIVRRTLLLERVPLRDRRAAPGLALAAALVWLVHPLQTQSVDYIIQRQESIMALFFLLTLYGVVRGAASAAARRKNAWYVLAVVACFLGMGCKESIVCAPLLVLLYDWIFLAESWRQLVGRRWALYVGLGGTWVHLAYLLLMVPIPLAEGGAGFELHDLTPWTYLLTQAGVILHYLKLSIWPRPLCFDYHGWPVEKGLAECWPEAAAVLVLVLLTIYGLLKRSWLGFLGAWFFLLLAPTSSIMPLTDVAFEHRMYLPLAAVVLLAVLAGYAVLAGQEEGRPERAWSLRGLRLLLVGGVVAGLGTLTFLRNGDYHNAQVMWSDVIAQRPDNGRAHLVLGMACRELELQEQAKIHLTEALRLSPKSELAYFPLFEILLEEGDFTAARAYTERVLENTPGFGQALGNLGRIDWEEGRIEPAGRNFNAAVRDQPQLAFARYNVAGFALEQGRTEEAMMEGKILQFRAPEWQEKANLQARKLVLKEDPTARDVRRALFHARLACLDVNGQDARRLDTLAIAQALAGHFPEAVTTARKAIQVAEAAHQIGQARLIRERLCLYQNHRPFRYVRTRD